MPKGTTDEGAKIAAKLYYENQSFFPYRVYLNWPDPKDSGNILYCDEKFVTLLYQWNNDCFYDISKVRDVSNRIKSNIYDFIDEAEKVTFVVDCENLDPYRLCAAIKSLDPNELKKVHKIILYDDIHSASAWRQLQNFVKIPVEHVLIERLKEDKSLVDMYLGVGTCKEHYQNQVDSFVLVSSDSDYWGLISQLPDARFLVMVEHEKCGSDLKAALIEHNIFYCYIDEFFEGDANDIKLTTLVQEIYHYLDNNISLNVNDMYLEASRRARVHFTNDEKRQFYQKYIKPMHIVIEDDGTVRFQLQAK